MEIGFTVAGFVVGFIVGMTGVGGGSLMTPILVLFFDVKPALAVGTDLLYAAVTKVVAYGCITTKDRGLACGEADAHGQLARVPAHCPRSETTQRAGH